MAKGYQLIQAQTLSSNVSSVTFSNIPQNYTDLVLHVSARSARASSEDGLGVQVNGVTVNYTYKTIVGNGSSVTNLNTAYENWWASELPAATATSSVFSNDEVYFPNYTSSSNAKIYSAVGVAENNASLGYISMSANSQPSTSAITSLTLVAANGNLVSGSTFYLYGVGGTRATGGTITSDANYTYHTFTSTGTFTALEKLKNVEALIIAGGGGGGSRSGGGGGAGGVAYLTGQVLNAGTSFSALIGAGGTGGQRSVNGTNGGDSFFGNAQAFGGGVGGSALGNLYSTAGNSGGSGGGGANNGSAGSATQSSGLNYIGFGYAGGASFNASNPTYDAGGGGGAGGTGFVPPGTTDGSGAGYGGIGTSAFTAWATATNTGANNGYYAGGGGGGSYGGTYHGSGGFGGGGAGHDTSPTAGTANTGGGGGGCGNSANTNTTPVGAAGGSGLVIVRYPTS